MLLDIANRGLTCIQVSERPAVADNTRQFYASNTAPRGWRATSREQPGQSVQHVVGLCTPGQFDRHTLRGELVPDDQQVEGPTIGRAMTRGPLTNRAKGPY